MKGEDCVDDDTNQHMIVRHNISAGKYTDVKCGLHQNRRETEMKIYQKQLIFFYLHNISLLSVYEDVRMYEMYGV